MSDHRAALAVLASGGGSNLQALIDACEEGRIGARVAVVFSNNPAAGALDRAAKAGIPTAVRNHKDFASPEELDRAILEVLSPFKPDWVCLAGYLRMVTPTLIQAYPSKILNIHPALLPAYGGKGFYGKKVHEAVIRNGDKVSGVTVHLVDERYDHGPILLQERVPVEKGDTPETLAKRVLAAEHRIYPEAVRLCVEGKYRVEAGKVVIL